jgi:hypothetical protein
LALRSAHGFQLQAFWDAAAIGSHESSNEWRNYASQNIIGAITGAAFALVPSVFTQGVGAAAEAKPWQKTRLQP